MSGLVAWFLIGVPAVAIAAAMFLGRSPRRALVGYLALLAGFAAMAMVDRVSAGILGGAIALLYAAGRGGSMEREGEQADALGVRGSVADTGPGHRSTSSEGQASLGDPRQKDRGAAGVR